MPSEERKGGDSPQSWKKLSPNKNHGQYREQLIKFINEEQQKRAKVDKKLILIEETLKPMSAES